MATVHLLDPLKMARELWPDVRFYREQRAILRSVLWDDETVVVAGHQLGKDYVTGYACLWFLLSSIKLGRTCRIVTTSVKDDHLRVLWGEIGRYIRECKYPLDWKKGGPLIVNHRDIRMAHECKGGKEGYSYLRGMVSEKGEGLAGHHAQNTLLVIDEASGVDQVVYERGTTWAKRCLIIGNPYPCEGGQTHFFHSAVKGGDVLAT